MGGNFEHSGRIFRLVLRRERVISTIWITVLVLFSLALAPGMGGAFDDAARQALAATLNNPAMIAMMGPVYGAENYTVGTMYAGTMLLWIVIAVAIMNVFLVVRHTRADEESGRAEVVRSLPTGRLANLNATMIAALMMNTILALLLGFGLAMTGVESMGLAASLLYGAIVGVSGLLFAALAALFCQLSSSSRGATAYPLLLLGLFYMMRAAGDIGMADGGGETLSLISPLGLILHCQVYVENHWQPVIILLLEVAVVTLIAYALNAIRDIDQGFLPARPGRTEASKGLRSSLGLSFRLLRNTLIGWFVVMFVLGASYGSILGDIDAFISESPFYQQIIGVNDQYETAQMFATFVNAMMALICLAPMLIVTLKPRGEEKERRAELVLSRGVSRGKYLAGYAVLALGASILFQVATALGLYAAATAVLEQPIALTFLLRANLLYLPALWVMMGLTIALTGLLPQATGVVWGYYGFCFFATFLERFPGLLPDWLLRISPFIHIPQLPADEVHYATLIILICIAAILTAAGFVYYQKRDTA